MESMHKTPPQEHHKARSKDKKKEGALPLLGQVGRRKAAAGSSPEHRESTPGKKNPLPCSTASCLCASKMEPPGARCLRCPALGAAGGRGSRHPLKLAVASSSLPELGPQKNIFWPRNELGRAGAKEERGPWRWRLRGELSGLWEQPQHPARPRGWQHHRNVLLTPLLPDSRRRSWTSFPCPHGAD